MSLLLDAATAAFLLPAALRVLHRRASAQSSGGFTKPQADTSDAPFCHLAAISGEELQGGQQQQRHPCEALIQQLLQHTDVDALSRFQAMPPPLAASPWHWVATPSALQAAVAALDAATCIAVDIEHNASRSYLGLTCLVQLSDGHTDYVFDAVALHDHMHLLRPLFADPNVLKVLHGASNDVMWLQRDFRIYLVNVFDTAACCQVLENDSRSLQHLLQAFCGVHTDKSYQQADWTQRPLSRGALTYARTDVHYSLHIAAVLAKQLEASDRLQQACVKSQSIALGLYAKPEPHAAIAAAATAVLRRFGGGQDAAQPSTHGPDEAADTRVGGALRDCVYALCEWRDTTARQQNEGIQHVLPGAAVCQLAQQRPHNPAEALSLMRDTSSPEAPMAHLSMPQAAEICRVLEEAAAGRSRWPDATQNAPAHRHAHVPSRNPKHLFSQAERRAALRSKLIKKFSAQAPVYENCRMLSREGDLLCFCDRAKVNWYLERGLAEQIGSNDDSGPLTIGLLFEHQQSDQNASQQHYYVASRENRCVCCGDASHYLRYRIVPTCYRRAFPVHLKSHRSHDIVLLCLDCHEVAHTSAEVLKRDICEEYGVPLMPDTTPPAGGTDIGTDRPAPVSVRRAAIALFHHRHHMPDSRRSTLEGNLRAHLGKADGSEVTISDIQAGMVAGLPRKSRNKVRRRAGFGDAPSDGTAVSAQAATSDSDGTAVDEQPPAAEQSAAAMEADKFGSNGHAWHGQKVVEKALARGGEAELLQLSRRFRERFVETLQPRFLPTAWHTDHSAKRDFGAYSIYRSKPLAPCPPGKQMPKSVAEQSSGNTPPL